MFIASLGFNIYWICRSYSEKQAIKNIVNDKIDPLIQETKENNDKINQKNEEFTGDLHKDLENRSTSTKVLTEEEKQEMIEKIKQNIKSSGIPNYSPPVVEENILKELPKKDMKTIDEEVHTVIIQDKAYEIKLEEDLKKSQEQTKYYMDQLSITTDHYEQIIKEKDEIINNLTNQLEETKKELTKDISKRNIDVELEKFRKNFARFGIDAYLMTGLPISEWIDKGNFRANLVSYDFGLGFNWMTMNKINIRLTTGIEYKDSNVTPKIGASVGYFFN